MHPEFRPFPRHALAVLTVALACAGTGTFNADDPVPPVVTPGAEPGAPPSDAIVLFDGTNLDHWAAAADPAKPAPWTAEGKPGGAMTVIPGSGSIISKRSFSSVQLHVEFTTPAEPKGDGQERGNSGVYLQGRYEVQVLDSFKSHTYPNGLCGAIYSKHPPLVNACRAPGLWQTYDIVFHAGAPGAPPRMTVLHNGVLIQDNASIDGPTTAAPFTTGLGDGPIYLQDHGNAVRYRTIWIRPLREP